MSTMPTGTLPNRFASALGADLRWQKVTWNTHSNTWEAAPQELRDKYIQAGLSPNGLWRNFCRDVRALYPDGKIPGKWILKRNTGIKIEHQDGDVIVVSDSD